MKLEDVLPEPRYTSIESLLEEFALLEFPDFKPNAFFNHHGDLLEVIVTPEPYYVRSLANGVDACISFASGQMIGVKVWGISRRIANPEWTWDNAWVKVWEAEPPSEKVSEE